ncbi:tetratricopeptide repeat protein [Pseudodesulfovibrio pelocollis]|uniref:tetratricopeptide repeat protein n=1 Tax=Pseudodesulfovibrio pelocollis TaxID=3051432 RepID=UPI00255AEF62|nr:tetratricopeptide repeat protein [Pseudodesulfovibrio sp. SB368]
MRNVVLGVLAASVLMFAGCAKVVGPYYLEQGKYQEGIDLLGKRLQENPSDADSAYYVARYHLALNRPGEAMPYMTRAVELAPDKADYRFWLGVTRWALLDYEGEREAYLEAVRINPRHISANLYLGHGCIDRGEWDEALARYDTVIALDKFNPEALYNRSTALGRLGRAKDEAAALKTFLEFYPDGMLALEATERLNLHGDFTYRNFILGSRNVTLRSMAFKPGTDELDMDSKESLRVVAAMMDANRKLALHVVGYVQGDPELAKARARSVRAALLAGRPFLDPARLPLSWFGSAETVEVGETAHTLPESVQFITVVR